MDSDMTFPMDTLTKLFDLAEKKEDAKMVVRRLLPTPRQQPTRSCGRSKRRNDRGQRDGNYVGEGPEK